MLGLFEMMFSQCCPTLELLFIVWRNLYLNELKTLALGPRNIFRLCTFNFWIFKFSCGFRLVEIIWISNSQSWRAMGQEDISGWAKKDGWFMLARRLLKRWAPIDLPLERSFAHLVEREVRLSALIGLLAANKSKSSTKSRSFPPFRLQTCCRKCSTEPWNRDGHVKSSNSRECPHVFWRLWRVYSSKPFVKQLRGL